MRNRTLLRRFGASALAFMLACSLAGAPAFAAEGDGTEGSGNIEASEPAVAGDNIVVVRKAVPGARYDLYKLLQLDAKVGEKVVEKDGEKVTEKAVVSYRYSYDAALKGIISEVVAMDGFAYDAGRGYGFKVDDDIVVFIAPEDEGTENAAVQAMMVAFADEMRSRIESTDGLTSVMDVTAPAAGENLVVSFKNVPDGYWMVTSNAGARSIVFTTPGKDGSKTMEVKEKNPDPKVTKKVWDKDDFASKGSWQDVSDAEIGETVDFMITVELYKGAENIRVHDELSEGLTFGNIKSVTFYPRTTADVLGREVYQLDGGTMVDGELKKDTSSMLDLTGDSRVYTETHDDRGFVLTFRNSFTNPAAGADDRDPDDALNNLFLGDLSTLEDDGGRIEIRYTATLNTDAVVGGGRQLDCDEGHEHVDGCYVDGNVNEAYVQYGHIAGIDPGEEPDDEDPLPPGTTPKEETRTYTYKFEIDKFVSGTEDDPDGATKLAGAEFELRKAYVGISGTGDEDSPNAWVNGDELVVPSDLYDISGSDPISLVDLTPDNEDYEGSKIYRVATPAEIAADAGKDEDDATRVTTTKVVTNRSGLITILGLDTKLYSITETAAPRGYNQLADPVMIAIGSAFSGNGGVVFEEDLDATRGEGDPYSFVKLADTTVGIANSSGLIMPDTGGIGTTIFYAGGAALVLGAGVLLVLKKRSGRSGD